MPGLISNEAIQSLVSSIDLVAHMRGFLELRKSSDHFVGKCPFHEDSTPSFHVYHDHYHCYGCNAHGDVIKYEMFRTGASFREATVALAEKYSVPIAFDESNSNRKEFEDRKRLLRLMSDVLQCFVENLQGNRGQSARDYLAGRGLTPAQIEAWKFGYSMHDSQLASMAEQRSWSVEDLQALGLIRKSEHGSGYYDFFRDRMMIPIRDEQGSCIAFAGRLIESASHPAEKNRGGKYMNSPETPLYHKSRVLFNLDKARAAVSRQKDVLVVEGYMDCISLANAGIENVVAVCGTALGNEHLKKLARYASRALLCFDSDAAGQKAAHRSFAALFPENLLELLHIKVPEGKDPDVFIQKHGAAAFRDVVKGAQSLLSVVVDTLRGERGTLEGWLRSVQSEVVPVILRNPDPAQREIALRVVADRLGLSDSGVLCQGKSSADFRVQPRTSFEKNRTVSNVVPADSESARSAEKSDQNSGSTRTGWRVSNLFELRLVVELLSLDSDGWIKLGSEFSSRIDKLENKLGMMDESSLVLRQILVHILAFRKVLVESGDAGGWEWQNDVLKVLWAVIRRDAERLVSAGFPSWPSEKEPPRTRDLRGIDVFSASGTRLLNFVLADVEGSVRRDSLLRQVERTLSELERFVEWQYSWSLAKSSGQTGDS